jgi:hypothetical protein
MATKWQGNILKFDLSYWIIRENKDISEAGQNLCGALQFDLACKKLDDCQSQVGVASIAMAVKKKCGILLKNLSKRSELNEMEILDMISHSMFQHRVDINSIEPDYERISRIFEQEAKNKAMFDRFSEKF